MNFYHYHSTCPPPVLKGIQAPVLFFQTLYILNSAPVTLLCLIQNISNTANAPCNHILTLESSEGTFLLIAACGSPFHPSLVLYPNPITPSAQAIPGVKWAVLLSMKKPSLMQYSQVWRVWSGSGLFASKYGLWNPRRNWQITHNFPFFFSLAYLGWQENVLSNGHDKADVSYLTGGMSLVPFSYLFDQTMRMSGMYLTSHRGPQSWLPKCSDE